MVEFRIKYFSRFSALQKGVHLNDIREVNKCKRCKQRNWNILIKEGCSSSKGVIARRWIVSRFERLGLLSGLLS